MRDYNFLDVAYQQVSATGSPGYLSAAYDVKEPGYAYLYVSNENPTIVDVYFDDVKVTHTPTNIIQYNDYYPFGLQTSTSWTRENHTNNFLYNEGSELNATTGWYETFFRDYDPAIGRFMSIDPMATKYASWSGYHYSANNPVMINDPAGAYWNGYSEEPWGGGPGCASCSEYWRQYDQQMLNQDIADFNAKMGVGNPGNLQAQNAALHYTNRSDLLNRARNGDMDALRQYAGMNGGGLSTVTGYHWSAIQRADGSYRNFEIHGLEYGAAQQGCPPGVDCDFVNNSVKNGLNAIDPDKLGILGTVVDMTEVSSISLRVEMIAARAARSGLSNIGRSGNLKTMYWLGQGSKWLGRAGNVAGGLSIVVEANAYNNGEMSGARFSFNTFGTLSSIGIGAAYGGVYGAFVGGVFTAAPMAYDGVVWFGDQVSKAAAQFNNGWRNGWMPGMK